MKRRAIIVTILAILLLVVLVAIAMYGYFVNAQSDVRSLDASRNNVGEQDAHRLLSRDSEGGQSESGRLRRNREWFAEMHHDPTIPFPDVSAEIAYGSRSEDPLIRLYALSRYTQSLVWGQIDAEYLRSDSAFRNRIIALLNDEYPAVRKAASELLTVFPQNDTAATLALLVAMRSELDDFAKHEMIEQLVGRMTEENATRIQQALVDELMEEEILAGISLTGSTRKLSLELVRMNVSPEKVVPRLVELLQTRAYRNDEYLLQVLVSNGPVLHEHEGNIRGLLNDYSDVNPRMAEVLLERFEGSVKSD